MSNKTKVILLAVLIPILVVMVLIGTHVICIFHEWIPATCTEPETCQYCDATQGEALGHKWEAATCETAKTCTVCGEVEGKPLGHDWQEATCLKAKECQTCGVTEGTPAGHQWQDATCTEPKTCSGCGETEGEALGHAAGDYEGGSANLTVDKPYYTVVRDCTVCGARVDTDFRYFTTFIDGDKFIITPNQFMIRYGVMLDDLNNNQLKAIGTTMIDGKLYGPVGNHSNKTVMAYSFVGTGADELLIDGDATNFRGVMGYFYIIDSDYTAEAVLSLVRAADPGVTFEEAKGVAVEIIKNKGSYYDYNGIRYGFERSGSEQVLIMTIEN